jgi:hypothetical protein
MTRTALTLLLFTATSLPAAEPAISAISVQPAELTLEHVRDVRRLLVTGTTAEGATVDLTGSATFEPGSKIATVDEQGFVAPVEAGRTTVVVTAGGKSVDVPVVVADVSAKPVSFVRDVLPVMSKVGCNAGTCHGAQAGKNGFKLSLRGYDPLYDYRALVDDVSGRRFNRARPGQSLMLLKPTQAVPHEGGFLFSEESRPYAIIEQWIAEGCRYDEISRVVSIDVLPKDPILQHAGDSQRHAVIAHFDDGSTRDVTRDAVFETSDFEVATVTPDGTVTAVRRGDAALLVRYEGRYASNAVTVTISDDRPDYEWNDSPEYNLVDEHVNDKLRRLRTLPSDLCTDGEFVRRITLDLTGITPTPEVVRAFIEDETPTLEKRTKLIDELLASPEYVEHWTLKWADLLLANRAAITEKGVWAFRNWIRRSVATNQPYDEFVRELITANGNTYEHPAANYYRVAREPKLVMENMTQVFLGTRFMCAQCHDHPFEKWTQTNYYELSAYFADVGRKAAADQQAEVIYELRRPIEVLHAGTNQAVEPAFPFEHDDYDANEPALRERLADWLVSPENDLFTKSIVNRYWSYFLGRGLIDPVDDIRISNPPSNPELLAALTEDFVANGHDLKRLIRTIVTSHTYQRSFETNAFNADDTVNNSHFVPRRLTAEQLYDAILVSTGAPVNIPGLPAGFRATQIPDPSVNLPFLDMFGRPPREAPCECERASEVSLKQTLNLVNGPTVANAIAHPQGRIAKLVEAKKSPAEIVDAIYVAVLCRRPSDEELSQNVAYFERVGNDTEAAQDLTWALLNTSAFLFNR